MSRYSIDDVRDDRTDREPERQVEARSPSGSTRNEFLGRHLDLDRAEQRDQTDERNGRVRLDRTGLETLATIGAFRVVAAEDLQAIAGDRVGDLRRLADQGLVNRETLTDRSGSRHIVSLTSSGKALVEGHRQPRGWERTQEFHANAVKPRELAHDVQVYRAFQEEQSRIEAGGGRITRVVLDYELKRDYQRFLNRHDKPEDATLESDRRAFAEAHGLRVIDGHLELPDLRIEYESPHGRAEHRDVEIVTEHYSRGQISGKTRAGFACYRAGGSGTPGGTPFDPHHLRRL